MSAGELKLVVRLVTSHARRHPGRIVLTALSTIASACIVVWVVSGYDAIVGQFGSFSEHYMGRYDLYVLPAPREGMGGGMRGEAAASIPGELVEALRHDPAVAVLDPMFETNARVRSDGDESGRAPDGAEGQAVPRRRGPPRAVAADGEEPAEVGNAPGPPQANGPLQPNGQPEATGPRFMGGMAQLKAQSRSPVLVGVDAVEAPHKILQGRWYDPSHPERNEAAITHDSAEALGVKLGGDVVVSNGREGETKLHIVAILEQPARLPPPKFMVGLPPTNVTGIRGGPASNVVYVPIALAEKCVDMSARTSNLGIALKSGANPDEFVATWGPKLAEAKPALEARTRDRVDTEADNSTSLAGVRAQAYSALGISMLAALFIIFTTLSMGVHERARQFAVLRAVALTKWQIAVMVIFESLLLGLIGWGGGLLAGWGLISMMAKMRPQAVAEGAALGTWCIALSGICAVGGALAASILPAWRATRVSPLEAMAPQNREFPGHLSWKLTLAGFVLIAINPLVVFFVPMQDTARYGVSAALGCTSMAIGFVLLAPTAVVLTEKLFAPALARVLALNPRLLSTQLSSNMWRTVGATIALTLGLGLFVAMETWGYSMLGPFTPTDWAPDLVVNISPVGVPDSEIDALRHIKGVRPDQFVPLAVKHVKFAEDILGFKVRPSATRQDSCVMVGVDAEIAFGGKQPMFNFDFAEGTLADALAKFKTQGRYCLVPDHFARDSGLGVGGKFAVVPPNNRDQPIEYEIAGVVSMPGWHWMSKMGFRRGRAAGLMFSPYETVHNDFETGRATMFWMNLDGTATESEIKASLEPIATRNYGASDGAAAADNMPEMGGQNGLGAPPEQARGAAPARGRGRMAFGGGGRRGGSASVTLRSREGVRAEIRQRADNIIWELGKLPLVTIAVTSLGVVNTVLSSIRARRWDLGVLRSMGLTRFGLFRLIIAEVLLIGVTACFLSLAFGAMAGYCGTGVTRYINIRGGQYTPLIIPWAKLSVGFAITMGLCLLAALWPATVTGRTEPLRLLQAGRGGI